MQLLFQFMNLFGFGLSLVICHYLLAVGWMIIDTADYTDCFVFKNCLVFVMVNSNSNSKINKPGSYKLKSHFYYKWL